MDDCSDCQAQKGEYVPHPLGVTSGQIVVDGDNVNPSSGQGVEIGRQGGDKSFPFTGLHFGYFSLMQHHAADQLHVEMAHIQNPA